VGQSERSREYSATPVLSGREARHDEILPVSIPVSHSISSRAAHPGGEHAPYGKKYIELIVDAHLLATSVNSLFSYNTFELNVGGFSVYASVEGGVLQKNQRETNIILFEVDEDVTEFDFIYDLDSIYSANDSPDYGTTQRTISVRLPTPATGE
jgi:hypothetical protein